MSTAKRQTRHHENERGIALLLVLWVIMFLAFVCAEFSWTMRTETSATINFKEGTQAYYAAEAGINRAVIELLRASAESRRSTREEGSAEDDEDDDKEDGKTADDMGNVDKFVDDFDDAEGRYDSEDDMQLWVSGGGPYRFEIGDLYCEVNIIDESNKININDFLKQAEQDPMKLKSLLEAQLGLESEETNVIADSLIDWWDKDGDVTGEFGAEDSYYESLDPPHFCRNGDLPAIEDCLSVCGITEEIFYGPGRYMEERIALDPAELERLLSGGGFSDPSEDEEFFDESDINPMQIGLVDLFSVNSNASSSFEINVNTASLEQLMLLEGMQLDSAEEIIEERSVSLFESSSDRLPQYANYEVWEDMIRVEQPDELSNYSLHARGFSRDGRISRSIRCNLIVSSSECTISNWRVGG